MNPRRWRVFLAILGVVVGLGAVQSDVDVQPTSTSQPPAVSFVAATSPHRHAVVPSADRPTTTARHRAQRPVGHDAYPASATSTAALLVAHSTGLVDSTGQEWQSDASPDQPLSRGPPAPGLAASSTGY